MSRVLGRVNSCLLWTSLSVVAAVCFLVSEREARSEQQTVKAQPVMSRSARGYRGNLPVVEKRLRHALSSAGLGEKVIQCAVGTNGQIRVAFLSFQVGTMSDRQASHRQIQNDAAAILHAMIRAEPDLAEIDLVAEKPVNWKEGHVVTRRVFTAAVGRPTLEVCLKGLMSPEEIIAGTGMVYWSPFLVDRPGESKSVTGIEEDATGLNGRGKKSDPALVLRSKIRAVLFGQCTEPTIALTFDDGPHPLYTPLILDLLKREGIKATFFIVGVDAREFPELLRRIAVDGHTIGNHTYSHKRLTKMSLHEARAELRITGSIVREITGETSRWYRPPGGECSVEVLEVLDQLGYIPVLWTNNTGDWMNPAPKVIESKALRDLKDGSIIMMHCDGMNTIRALPNIIKEIRSQGLGFGTIEDLTREHGCQHLSPITVAKISNPPLRTHRTVRLADRSLKAIITGKGQSTRPPASVRIEPPSLRLRRSDAHS